jgi:hypothetical protein
MLVLHRGEKRDGEQSAPLNQTGAPSNARSMAQRKRAPEPCCEAVTGSPPVDPRRRRRGRRSTECQPRI